MTSQRDNTMRIRRRATLVYVKWIDATRYIAPCMSYHTTYTWKRRTSYKGSMIREFWHVYILWLGYPLQWPRYTTFRLNFFNIMTSQRHNTMRIRRRATLEYVKRIDATRYIAPCMSYHTTYTWKRRNSFNPLNAELNSIWHLLAFFGAHTILHVSRIRVKGSMIRDFFYNFLSKIVLFMKKMWNNFVELDTPQMILWRMRIAGCIPKATDTHSEYVIRIAFPLQQWL